MSYKLAIFDMDGTVLDTLDDLANAVNHTLIKFGMPTRSNREVRSYLGNGVRRLIESAAPDGTKEAVIDEMLQFYRAYYGEHSADKTAPYKGIEQALKKLRENGCKTALLSNKPDAPAVALTKKYFDGLFDYAAGEKEGIERKPSPDGLYPIFETFRIDKSEAVFIGDSEVDIMTAKNADMDCIAVTWGFRDRDELIAAGGLMLADSADELLRLILS